MATAPKMCLVSGMVWMEHLAEWRATRQFTGTLPYPQKVSALHSQADGGALDRLADRHAGLAQQSELHGYEGPLYVFMGTTGRATGKFEHGTGGCNVYYSICCFLLVIYLHLHSSGSFSPGRHNLAPTLTELDFNKNNHMWGRRGDSSKNPWLGNCPACSVHQTCRWVGTTCGAMVAVRILNGDAICSDRTHGSIHL